MGIFYDEYSGITDFTLILIIIFIILVISGLFIHINNKNAIASEKAQQICESKGYDTYDTFERKLFSDEPLGVRCNYIRNSYEIMADVRNELINEKIYKS